MLVSDYFPIFYQSATIKSSTYSWHGFTFHAGYLTLM